MDLDEFIARYVQPSKQHNCFYHFTDGQNIASIRQHGILSTRQLSANGIKVPAPGGNDWSMEADRRVGMDGYVHLTFLTGHPMEYHARRDGRIKSLNYLNIHPAIIKFPGVMITNEVANKAGVIPRVASEMLDQLDLEVIYRWTDWKDLAVKERLKIAHKYEILIPDRVPQNFIGNLGNG